MAFSPADKENAVQKLDPVKDQYYASRGYPIKKTEVLAPRSLSSLNRKPKAVLEHRDVPVINMKLKSKHDTLNVQGEYQQADLEIIPENQISRNIETPL